MFYGLKPNGRGYFSNDNTNKEITIEGNSYYDNGNQINIKERYESKNRLIYLARNNEIKESNKSYSKDNRNSFNKTSSFSASAQNASIHF